MSKTQANDKFQGLCLSYQDDAGKAYIYLYDRMPPELREMIQNTPSNLCIMCLIDRARELSQHDGNYDLPTLYHYRTAIQAMEAAIRCEEVQ